MTGRACHGVLPVIGALLAAALMLAASGARAQGLSLNSQDAGEPINIYAEDGIEWVRESDAYIARGNAKMSRGATTVEADVLTAFTVRKPDGGSEIERLDANGNVRLSSNSDYAFGDNGYYKVSEGYLQLTGNVGLQTKQDLIRADRSLEYWEAERVMVASGNAVATREEKVLRADRLTIYLSEDASGNLAVSVIKADGNVHLSTTQDIVTGQTGVYNVKSGMATLSGGVKITRGNNQLNGQVAEIDLNTGISTLRSQASGAGQARVQGLFVPKSKTAGGG